MASPDRIHGDGDGDGEGDGWPLGLQPLTLRMRLLEHLRLADATSFFQSTPSITSESSSDLDTESTGSFFPERSTTLGSLIGIQSRDTSQAITTNELLDQNGHLQNPNTNISSSRRRSTAPRHRLAWCSLLGCASSADCQESMSPSLAHFLEMERQAAATPEAISHRQDAEEDREAALIGSRDSSFTRNTLFNDERILPPQASGAPLKLVMQQSNSPSSSYLSADWSNTGNVAASDEFHGKGGASLHQRGGGDHNHGGRMLTLWPSICGRLDANIAC